MQDNEEKKVTSEKPISLAGVDFKKLMGAFLQVKPEEDKDKDKEANKRRKQDDK